MLLLLQEYFIKSKNMFKFVMTKNSNELFHRAVIHNDIKRVRLILEEAMKDPRFNIDDINEEGLTALQFSCFAGNLELVKILISYGANWKIRDRDGYTILHAAALAGYGDVVKYLLRTGLKPTLRTDGDTMPIDVTDEVSIIVILLRSMLDQGFLREMQDYMLDHPKLKRNIFEELEKVKCREKEKNEILKDLPYTSHTSPRKHQPKYVEKFKHNDRKGRSRSTFSELSGSMQQLDILTKEYDENNNNCNHHSEPLYAEVQAIIEDVQTLPLRRHNSSSSSTSSHESRTSRNSTGSSGILRNDKNEGIKHQDMQQYLENRYPVHSKSVTFDLHRHGNNHRSYSDGYISDNTVTSDEGDSYNRRAYSDGYISDTYNENLHINRRMGNMSKSPHPLNYHDNFSFQQGQKEPLYENMQTFRPKPLAQLATIVENHYENLPLKHIPPPVPPREPQNEDNSYGPEVPDRQFGSETDSGIDIDETTGRVFALSLDDQRDTETYQNCSQNVVSCENQSYSKPIGLFYSNESQHVLAKQTTVEDTLPLGFFLRPNNNINSKYRSWNCRTLQHTQLAPYASHRRSRTSKDDHDLYNNIQLSTQNHDSIQQYPGNNDVSRINVKNSQNYYRDNDARSYNFDHQPEIML